MLIARLECPPPGSVYGRRTCRRCRKDSLKDSASQQSRCGHCRIRALSGTVNVQLPTAPGAASCKSLPRRGKSRDRSQLVAMQQTLFGLVQNPEVAPHIRAQCARAWSDLQERKRVLDGKPLPGMLRPELEQPKRRKGGGLLAVPLDDYEPVPAESPKVVTEVPQPKPRPVAVQSAAGADVYHKQVPR